MPPCAQTECERFTGTIENRSTLPPASAILITDDKPASPPPTTIILGTAAIVYSLTQVLLLLCQWWLLLRIVLDWHRRRYDARLLRGHHVFKGNRRRIHDGDDAPKTCRAKHCSRDSADPAKLLPRAIARRDAPLRCKEPDAVGKVPARYDHADHINRNHKRIRKLILHLPVGEAGMLGQAHAGEPLEVQMLNDVGQRQDARHALGQIHPVARPRIDVHIGATLDGNVYAVERVEGEWDKDEGPLQHTHKRKAVQELYLLCIRQRAMHDLDVRDDVFDQKCADGNNAGQRVKPAQHKRVSLARAQWLNTLDRMLIRWWCRCSDRSHSLTPSSTFNRRVP